LRTERRSLRRHPGRDLGCRVFLFLLLCVGAASADAQELFSWYDRGLLSVRFEPGDWIRFASEQLDEGGLSTDTLTVQVAQVDTARVWLIVDSGSGRDYVELDPVRIRNGEALDALSRIVSETDEGLVETDVAELRASALARRHFADPFVAPEVESASLPDTTIAEREISRRRVELIEERRETAGQFTVVTRLSATAELSEDLPVLGVIHSRTVSEVTTESPEGSPRRRRPPPILVENSVRCLGFGHGPVPVLPEGLHSRQ
jgi:hypothetical protein